MESVSKHMAGTLAVAFAAMRRGVVRLAVVIAAFAAAAALPEVASAHVGRTLPVATNFTARILHPVPGIEAKVVDGDQTMWLRVPASETVAVPGTLGEPLLRFDRGGVWLNLRSPTAQQDAIDKYDLRPSANPAARPLWHRLTHAHAYAWHEHRLHLLQPLAKIRKRAGPLGPWAVPVVAGGRRESVSGVLDYRPPHAVWAWIALTAVLAAAAAAAAARRTRVLLAAALAATPLVWTIRIGRELYGRPFVPVIGWVEVGITCVVGAALLYGLLQRDAGIRILAAFLVGFGALYEGLTMFPLLTHAIALNALPTGFARVVEALVLVTGIGALAGSVFGHLRVREAAGAAG
jgi:hypothetical protein